MSEFAFGARLRKVRYALTLARRGRTLWALTMHPRKLTSALPKRHLSQFSTNPCSSSHRNSSFQCSMFTALVLLAIGLSKPSVSRTTFWDIRHDRTGQWLTSWRCLPGYMNERRRVDNAKPHRIRIEQSSSSWDQADNTAGRWQEKPFLCGGGNWHLQVRSANMFISSTYRQYKADGRYDRHCNKKRIVR